MILVIESLEALQPVSRSDINVRKTLLRSLCDCNTRITIPNLSILGAEINALRALSKFFNGADKRIAGISAAMLKLQLSTLGANAKSV